jgi:hypothetical protein
VNGAPTEVPLGHSRFDQTLPTAINKAEWIELAIAKKWEDGVEQEVSENIATYIHLTFLLFI